MNIAFCVIKNIHFGGGVEKYTFELGRRLVARGHDVTVYCMPHYGEVADECRGMRIVPVPCLHQRKAEKLTASVTSSLAAALDKHTDVIHFHDIASGSCAGLARALAGRRCVMQFHGLGWKRSRWGRTGVWAHKLLEKAAVRQSHAYTAVSREQCDYFRERYGLPVTYIPTGAEIKAHTPMREARELGLAPEEYVLFASRLVREKGAHYLIPAFRKLDTSCKLVLAGDASDPAYHDELRALAGGDERILFAGFVQGRPLAELFSNARVYVQPSEIEGLSIALLEAMSYGRPCLVSDIPANLEATGTTGWTFESRNIAGLAEQMDWLLRHPEQTRRKAHKARERVRDEYSWDRIADQFERLYEKVLSSKAA